MAYSDSVLDVLAHYEELRRQGEQLTPEELCADCPENLPEVRQALEKLRPLERLIAVAPEGTEKLPVLPGYEILAELGRGGMGVVYLARQEKLKRFVALKMILHGAHAGVAVRARFRREAEAAANLRHSGIVQIHETGEQEGRPYLVLEYIPGGNLAQRLAGTPQQPQTAATVVAGLARAMHHAHEMGIIHRDLKPGNVLIDGKPGTPLEECTLKVADFGLAKHLDGATRGTHTGQLVGTVSYMAPEQAAGDGKRVGVAADVYALGTILYEMLTGRPPFQAPTPLETLDQVRAQEPVPPTRLQPKLPRDLETICVKCLQKEPGKRYETATDLAEDLERYLTGKPIRARPVGLGERTWRWCRRNSRVASLLALLAVVITSGLVGLTYLYLLSQKRLEEAEAFASLARKFIQQTHEMVTTYRESGQPEFAKILVDMHEEFIRYAGDKPALRGDLAKAYVRLHIARQYQSREALRSPEQQEADKKAALEAAKQASKIMTQLVRENPGDREARRTLGWMLTHEATESLTEGNSLKLHEEARALQTELAREDPTDRGAQTALATSWVNIALSHSRSRGYQEALRAAQSALEILERLANDNPADVEVQRLLASPLQQMSELYRKLGDPGKSVAPARRAVAILRKVGNGGEAPIQEYLFFAYDTLGHALSAAGEKDEAILAFRQAESLVRQRVEAILRMNPQILANRADLVWQMRQRTLEEQKQLPKWPADAPQFDGLLVFGAPGPLHGLPSALVRVVVVTQFAQVRRSWEEILTLCDHLKAGGYQQLIWGHDRSHIEGELHNNIAVMEWMCGHRGNAVAHRFQISIDLYKDLVSKHPEKGNYREELQSVLVNLACWHAHHAWFASRVENPAPDAQRDSEDEAIRCLREAVRHGLKDANKLLNEPDLAPLHDHPEFRKLVERLSGRKDG